MKTNKKTPSQGLKILESLHEKYPNHQWIRSSLINTYIKLGKHDTATDLINNIPNNISDVSSLQFKAWAAHQQGDISKEKLIWNNILTKIYKAEIAAPIHSFVKMSKTNVVITIDDIPLICVERNEISRLPHFLKYYRKLGITQFFFVDNNSDDGSLEFLLEQPDCHVFWTDDSHNEAGSGVVWVHYLINNYLLKNQWCLHVDADEFLVYPNCETHKLTYLIKYLHQYGYTAQNSFIIDMFPKDIETQKNISINDDLITVSPYFYNNYRFYYQSSSPYITPSGGLFFPYCINLVLTKTALFQLKEGFHLLSATHNTMPTILSDISCAYLHFKMIGDFYEKSNQEQSRKQHSRGGINYRGYAKMYESFSDENFDFTKLDKTVKYENSQQLVELGLIRTSNEWEKFCAE